MRESGPQEQKGVLRRDQVLGDKGHPKERVRTSGRVSTKESGP